MTELYKMLRDRLDTMATGYPATESGVEIRILKQLFSEEDAALFLAMSTEPQTADAYASRLGTDLVSIASQLEDMAGRGLIFRLKEGGTTRYLAMPFIVGIYEFQLNHLNTRLLKDMSEYYITALGATFHSLKTPHLRSIPINSQIVSKRPISSYDDAATIIKSKSRIAVADCLCRKAVRMYGKGCSHPLETCLQFDSYADYYTNNGMARSIDTDEALEILKRNEGEGLVIQIPNSQNVEAMCACCTCCCGMLISLKLFPSPDREVMSNYVCQVDDEMCTSCGTCLKRCPVGAVMLKDGRASFRPGRCIGCGLCVTTCPGEARTLTRKPDGEIYTPPETMHETFVLMKSEKNPT